MNTIKTAFEITDEVLDRNYAHLDPEQDGNFADGLEVALSAGDVDYNVIRALMEAAIEAERAQHDLAEKGSLMNINGLPPIPSWDEEGATIDLPLVDQIIDDVLVNWGCEIRDYSDPDWPTQLAGMIGPGEAVEYEEIYGMLRDLVQHTLNTVTSLKEN